MTYLLTLSPKLRDILIHKLGYILCVQKKHFKETRYNSKNLFIGTVTTQRFNEITCKFK
jgi:hypothetical protein